MFCVCEHINYCVQNSTIFTFSIKIFIWYWNFIYFELVYILYSLAKIMWDITKEGKCVKHCHVKIYLDILCFWKLFYFHNSSSLFLFTLPPPPYLKKKLYKKQYFRHNAEIIYFIFLYIYIFYIFLYFSFYIFINQLIFLFMKPTLSE